jgi:alpha-mannosidase
VARLRLTVACSADPAAGRVELRVPAGLVVDAPAPAYDLAAGAHREFALTVRADAAAPGTYFLAAAISDALGQTIEDVTAVTVGADGADGAADEALDVTCRPDGLALPPGGRGELVLGLRNRARGEIRGTAQVISPYGTWGTDLHVGARTHDAAPSWTQGFTVAPGAAGELRFPVGAATTARPGGHWWALVKVAYFGRLHYTRAVPIRVIDAT